MCACVRTPLAQDATAACGESMPLAHLNGTMCARQPPSTIEAPLRLAWDGRHSEPSQPRSTASASNFREAPITVPSSQRLTRRVTFMSRLPLDAIAGAIAGANKISNSRPMSGFFFGWKGGVLLLVLEVPCELLVPAHVLLSASASRKNRRASQG